MNPQNLFNLHVADLKSVLSIPTESFVCPICLGIFDVIKRDEDKKQILNEGHIFPDYFRDKLDSFNKSVLLCENCNSKSGTHGDEHMQLAEQIKDGKASGELFGERRIHVVPDFHKPPIILNNVNVNLSPDIKLLQDLRINPKGNNPKEIEKYGTLTEPPCLIKIEPHHPKMSPSLAKVGALTAAYLFAFYTFGYRYVFSPYLNPVRDCIRKSFETDRQQIIQLPPSDFISITNCGGSHTVPEITLAFVFDRKTPVRLSVCFLNYHIKLPFTCNPDLLSDVIQQSGPNLPPNVPNFENREFHIPPITCNKMEPHDCFWDDILWQTFPGDIQTLISILQSAELT